MPQPAPAPPACPLTLWAETAADLMMPNPISLRAEATIREAIAALTDHGFSAAPVIDEAGRPVGVLSRGDILLHDRHRVQSARSIPGYYEQPELAEQTREQAREGIQSEKQATLVRDIMTPAIYAVGANAPAARVIQEMLTLKVHRLFVVDADETLIGVISALDVLRHLRPC